MQEISLSKAKKLALNAQGIYHQREFGNGAEGCLAIIEHLGYIQIDTISVIERAHNHTLWNRHLAYSPSQLAELHRNSEVFEYWSHAAAYLPMKDFRYSLPRKHAIASGQRHWYDRDVKLNRQILDRIKLDGPVRARDFENSSPRSQAEWGAWKPAKRALEQLFMEGELMIVGREGFQKVYDLTERVLPSGVDSSMPTDDEHLDHLIFSYLRANALGTPAQMAYLLKGLKPGVKLRCQQLLEDGRLQQLRTNQHDYYAIANVEAVLEQRSSRSRMMFLSPFDNVIIQRERARNLFSFDYQIECYVPAKKRKFGYFCLPILLGQNIVGRLDAKVDRKSKVLAINSLFIENANLDAFLRAWDTAISEFAQFNGADRIRLDYLEVDGLMGSPRLKAKLNRCMK